MRKKGFTLIELLAVIVILAIIALIATPMILGVIDSSKKGAVESSAYGYMEAIENSRLKNIIDSGSTDLLIDGTYDLSTIGKVDYKGEAPKNMCITIVSGNIASGSFEFGSYIVDYDGKKAKVNSDKTEVSCNGVTPSIVYKDPILNGADPELDEGMIPIYFDGNTAKKADTKTEWYNYTDKKWANVVLVSEDARESFKNMKPGTEIDTSKVLAYFVWIPRYKYAFPPGDVPRPISIAFENKTIPKSTGSAVDTDYLTHPAFTFGTTELNGYWVGKFEPSAEESSACYIAESKENCDNTNQNPRILPNVKSISYQKVANQFLTAQKFTSPIYGYTGNSRMMKNSEWGAVAYLSHSVYGINMEVRINNNENNITGCGASTENAGSSTVCDITYGRASDFNYPQSTTGNINGIFDMSGGAWEYVMGVLADSSGKPYSGVDSSNNSGFNGTYGTGGSLTNGTPFPSAKYYDLYTEKIPTTACNGSRCLGDGTAETWNWYGNTADFVSTIGPWFVRGGTWYRPTLPGMFSSSCINGRADGFTFRVVLSEE